MLGFERIAEQEAKNRHDRLEDLIMRAGVLAHNYPDPQDAPDPATVLAPYMPDEEVEEGDVTSDTDETVFDTTSLTWQMPTGGVEEEMRLLALMHENAQVQVTGDEMGA